MHEIGHALGWSCGASCGDPADPRYDALMVPAPASFGRRHVGFMVDPAPPPLSVELRGDGIGDNREKS